MDLEDVFEIVCSYLDDEICNNKDFKKIVMLFFNIAVGKNEDYFVLINRNIYLENEKLQDDDRILAIEDNNSKDVLYIEFNDECLCFSILFDGTLNCSLRYSCENKYYEDIIIDLEIREDMNVWKTIKEVYDSKQNYHDFIVDVISYDKKHKVINKEESLDQRLNIFQEFFSISRDDARKCIDKFSENKRFLNNSRMLAEMGVMDDMFSLNFCKFVEPFRMCEFKERIKSDIEKYLGECDESLMDIDSKVNNLYNNLISVLGEDGEYTFSFNLILNIVHYLVLDFDILYSNGIIVKKDKDGYTIYNVNFSNEDILVIPSDASLEYVQSLYLSADINSEVVGLAEFFGFGNRKVLG